MKYDYLFTLSMWAFFKLLSHMTLTWKALPQASCLAYP